MTNNKRETVLKISKHLDDPSMAEELLALFDERKKEAIDYRRGGVITIFVGIGIYLLGVTSMGSFFEGIGLLVSAIGAGIMVAGYLYPNTSKGIALDAPDLKPVVVAHINIPFGDVLALTFKSAVAALIVFGIPALIFALIAAS